MWYKRFECAEVCSPLAVFYQIRRVAFHLSCKCQESNGKQCDFVFVYMFCLDIVMNVVIMHLLCA